MGRKTRSTSRPRADAERALEGSGGRSEQRADLTQVLIEDRPTALVAGICDQLADPRSRDARLGAEQAVDLLLVRIELRGDRRPLVVRRRIRAQCTADRDPAAAGARADLLDLQPLHEVHPLDLGPLLHVDDDLLLAPSASRESGFAPGERAPLARGVSFRLARGGQYSGAADTSASCSVASAPSSSS